jgi:hypothetical protein
MHLIKLSPRVGPARCQYVWLETQLTHIPQRSGLADAIRYALTRWSALGLFIGDGRIELDNNTVELFAGSDGGAAR